MSNSQPAVITIRRSGVLVVRNVAAQIPDALRNDLREALVERFVRENPVYMDARRFRRPCRHIPRQVSVFEESADSSGLVDWKLPRGAENDVIAVIKEHCPGYQIELIDETSASSGAGFRLSAELRDYQTSAVRAAVAAGQGVIQAPTGSGKTVIACGLIAATGLDTLFVVHTSVLLEQTAAAVRTFLGVEPGIIGGGRFEPAAVTVAMVQTLARRDNSDIFGRFGMVILDEAHHCPAESFKSIVAGFRARHRFGLTATPTRKDRLHPVLFDVIGPVVAKVNAKNLMVSGSITPVEVVRVDTAFKTRYTKDYSRLVNRIAANRARNELVIDKVVRHMGERTLVLSERVEHCDVLAAGLELRGVPVLVLTGGVPREDRAGMLADFSAGVVRVLVSTSSLVGEGFDLPALDTVVVTIPNGNTARTTQLLGRALRPSAGKEFGRIVDFCDFMVPLLFNQYQRRAAVYRKFAIRETCEGLPVPEA